MRKIRNLKMNKNCKQCNKEFKANLYQIKRGRGKFCSRKCQGKFRTQNLIGEKSPNWKGGGSVVSCLVCNKKFHVKSSKIKIGSGKFCSRQCYGEWMSKNLKGANNPSWRGGKIELNCLICNKHFETCKSNVKKGKTKFCSRKCLGKWISKNLNGEKSYSWKGGITPENHKIRQSLEYRQWAKTIKERDKFTCAICKIKGGKLRSNHIKRFIDSPNLRLDLNNGITICENCDLTLVLNREEKWESYFNNILKRGNQL